MEKRKVLVLGIDGMDPKMTKRLLDEGKLPNIEKMLSVGSAREDLVMLGGNPTITPPMWTTLATGAYPMTHGITCYWNNNSTRLDRFQYVYDTALIKAEQIWENVVKSGKKALVWTWPCSWPARIDSPDLHIVGGLCPQGPNACSAVLEGEFLTYASENNETVTSRAHMQAKGGAGCILTDDMAESISLGANKELSGIEKTFADMYAENGPEAWLLFDHMEGEELMEFETCIDGYNVPLKGPKAWGIDVPEGAKEFAAVTSYGAKLFPCLVLKNEEGIYDTVAVYANKKATEPVVVIKDGEFYGAVPVDFNNDGKIIKATRSFSIVKMDPNGTEVVLSIGTALDIETERKSSNWLPESLYQQTIDIAGYVPYAIVSGGGAPERFTRRVVPSWDNFQKWQAKALLGLIEQNEYDAVFTHNHSCDHFGHPGWRWAKTRKKYGNNDEKVYQAIFEEVYFQVDNYIGEFLPLLDKGWTIIVTSDHGLLCGEEDEIPYIGEAFVMNVGVMKELGYTVLKKDPDGNELREIDWEKTTAVAPRGNHIYINLKGRNPAGIVDPADKYELERKIIDDLYNYRFEGKRVINIAMRNKDAALIGMSGENSGDIIYFLEEGFNRLHGDALSTTEGYFGTSVSPIFFAAGSGVKKGFKTDRVIREVDVAPTVAAIMGIGMPAQCEGAPVYQILEDGVYKL